MIKRVTRPQLKKLLQESGSVIVNIGNIHNGVFWGGCYRVEVTSMEQAEQAMQYAKSHGWEGKLYFGV